MVPQLCFEINWPLGRNLSGILLGGHLWKILNSVIFSCIDFKLNEMIWSFFLSIFPVRIHNFILICLRSYSENYVWLYNYNQNKTKLDASASYSIQVNRAISKAHNSNVCRHFLTENFSFFIPPVFSRDLYAAFISSKWKNK